MGVHIPCGIAAALAALMTIAVPSAGAQQAAAPAVAIDNDDIGGVVKGPGGPEAGVWVIAETTDLPTKFAKVVVTDDQGRYVIPDLPKATYSVWVRGYVLVDSDKVQAQPGKSLNLTAKAAPNAKAAAEYYPGMYWYSMLKIPDESLFSGDGFDDGVALFLQQLPGQAAHDLVVFHQQDGALPAFRNDGLNLGVGR